VLDAGCGSGGVTRLLAERLPRGRVIAVDGSAAMAGEATARLADLARVRVVHMDLLDLALPAPVDAVFSSAVFHWIHDHERLFRRLAEALAPGGRMAAQCGGAGNVAGVLAAAREVAAEAPYTALAGFGRTWSFATAEATRARLAEAGFVETRTWLAPADVHLAAGEEAERYLATVVLRDHLAALQEPLREGFTRLVAERLREPDGRVRLDYVRLNIDARRAP